MGISIIQVRQTVLDFTLRTQYNKVNDFQILKQLRKKLYTHLQYRIQGYEKRKIEPSCIFSLCEFS